VEETMIFDLEHFRQDLFNRAKEQVYNAVDEVHTKEAKDGVSLELFNVMYDICYVSAINKPLEDLIDLYIEKGFEVTLDVLQEIQTKCRKDISKMRALLQITIDNLMESGLDSVQALESITNYRVSENAC